jgi:hypothetical protein
MRYMARTTILAASLTIGSQPLIAQNESVKITGGGISVAGWKGKVDASEAKRGLTLNDAKLAKGETGDGLHVTTGPAVSYWNPANTASGSYTVKATFTEAKYMSLNDHPHPYGLFIGGTSMGTDDQSYLYCAAYGNGTFIVRGFGPAAFQMNGRGESNPAIHKAAARYEPVTQEIAITVSKDKVECAINGSVVASYNKSDVVAAGKLKSTDGIYGIRFGHNTDGVVTGLTVTKQ